MHLLLTVALSAQVGAALPPDSIRTLRDRARNAEARFERIARQRAPVTWSAGSASTHCDEIVGRFCLRFDSGSPRPEGVEVGSVVDARREAVEAVRRYFSAAPGELGAAGPLVRLLIRDGRTSEAVSGAGAFAALSPDTIWGELLLGFAHHWHGADSVAERHFITALARMSPDERRTWIDISWLLDPDERSRFRRLTEREREEYERRFWLMTDPFWLKSANTLWNEHVSRRIEAHLLARVPVVGGMVRWGRDLDELTIRYGTPSARARAGRSPMAVNQGTSMIEYWDTAQRGYTPTRLTRGFDDPPEPGSRPPLYANALRAAYAIPTVARVLAPEHQVTTFLRSDSVYLRVDAAVPMDGEVTVTPVTGLFVYDSTLTTRSSTRGMAMLAGDTARFRLVLGGVPRGRIIYSAELLTDSTVAARARHAFDVEMTEYGPAVSGLLITRPFPTGELPDSFDDVQIEGLASLVVKPGDTLGVYAEIYRLAPATSANITLSLESVDGPSIFRRFGQWLGLVDADPAPTVAWRMDPERGTRVVALNLPLDLERTGMHALVIRVRVPGESPVESRRLILIRE